MKLKRLLIFFLILFVRTEAGGKGRLFIIGGGSIPGYMIEKFAEISGGRDALFVIIPMASAEPKAAAESFARKLASVGCSNIKVITAPEKNADCDSNLAAVKMAGGIFFTGGDQSKLTSALKGTKLLGEIRKFYERGGSLGGTSAGAAVMSEMMLTGNELKNRDSSNAYNSIKKGNIETSEGFGFLQNVIVDQHFIKRKRINRLISLVLENPGLTGIGIDESTAIIINQDGTFSVLGESLVTVLDASSAEGISSDKNGHISARDIKMHLLKSGDVYRLNKTAE